MIQRPKRNIESAAIITAIGITLYIIYSIFLDKSSIFQKAITMPSGILVIIFILGATWGWVIYASKSFNRKFLEWIEFLKSSNKVSGEIKETVLKYEKSFLDKIITRDELFNKLVPISIIAEKQLQEIETNKKNIENSLLVEKIKIAYKDGILTQEEMEKKLDELKKN